MHSYHESSNVAVFGEPKGYLVALRQLFEMQVSDDGASFAQNSRYLRAIMRGTAQTRAATWFARLQLASQ